MTELTPEQIEQQKRMGASVNPAQAAGQEAKPPGNVVEGEAPKTPEEIEAQKAEGSSVSAQPAGQAFHPELGDEARKGTNEAKTGSKDNTP